MEKKKYSCKYGWIVVVSDLKGEVIEIHSTGLTCSGRDDRAFSNAFFHEIGNDIISNALHTQQTGRGGVRWPEE